MAATNTKVWALPEDQRQLLESWLVDFDQCWEEGRLSARARELPPVGNPLRLPALVEMVKIDLERTWQRGRREGLETYLERFPELGTADTVPADLLQAEYEVRQQFGDSAALADLERRFPRRAQELRRLLQQGPGTVGPLSGIPVTCATPMPQTSTYSDARAVPGTDSLPEQFGRYRILKMLGKGGMGSVHLAHDTQLDRPVALKIPLLRGESPEVLERFYREARAAAALRHPHICPLYDVGEVNGIPYLTMAYIDGRPLSELVRAGQLLPPGQAAAMVRQLALALEVAHRHEVIHRDLKPANVLLNQDGEPVITDFGLARRLHSEDVRLTRAGAVLGTPAYMAPEQVGGETAAIGPACDIYSLGVILYELFTGRLPFRGPDLMGVMAQVLTAEPERPSAVRPDLDPQLEVIVMKAMAKKIEDRYGMMGEFAAALGEYLRRVEAQLDPVNRLARKLPQPAAQEAVGSGPNARKELPTRPTRRRRGAVAMGLVAALALLLSGVVVVIRTLGDPTDWDTGGSQVLPPVSQSVPGGSDGEKPAPREKSEEKDPKAKGLSEATLLGLLTAGIEEDAIMKRLQHGGVAFKVDAEAVARLKKAGASDRLVRLPRSRPLPLPDGVSFEAGPGRSFRASARPEEGAPPLLRAAPPTSPAPAADPQAIRGWIEQLGDDSFPAREDAGRRLRSVGAPALELLRRAARTDPDPEVRARAGALVKDIERALFREVGRLEGHKWHVLSVAFSPDGKRVASTGYDMTVKVWDPTSGKGVLNLTGHGGGAVDDVAFSPDGKLLASAGAGDGVVKVWNATTGEEVFSLRGHTTSVYGVAFSPDGRYLASGSGDQTVKVWDVASGREMRTLKGPGMGLIYRVAYSPDGKLLASSGQTVKVWDAASGQEIRSFAGALLLAFSPDGKRLATAGWEEVRGGYPKGSANGRVTVWDLTTGQQILTFEGQGKIWGLAYSPDGKRLATAGDLTVKTWDAASGTEDLTFKGHTDSVRCVVFSPDGRQVLSGSNDRTVRLWKVPPGDKAPRAR